MDCEIDWLCENFCEDFSEVGLNGNKTVENKVQQRDGNTFYNNSELAGRYDASMHNQNNEAGLFNPNQNQNLVGVGRVDAASVAQVGYDKMNNMSLQNTGLPANPSLTSHHPNPQLPYMDEAPLRGYPGHVAPVPIEQDMTNIDGSSFDDVENRGQPKKLCIAKINATAKAQQRSEMPSFEDSRYEPADSRYEPADSTAMEELSLKKRDQKRRPKPKDGSSMLCQICGDRALGYNFDAITCESCKAFFRRNALKAKVFTCSFEGNCKLDAHTRKFCSGCRLKKCFEVGMKKNWILTDTQLAKRRRKTSQTMSSEEMGQYPPMSQTQLSPNSACSTYMGPQKHIYSPQSSSSDGEITTTYMSDSTDPSISSPLNSFSPPFIKKEPTEEDFPRPLPQDIVKEIENLEVEYKKVFDVGYSQPQAMKMVEKPGNANDLFNMTDIFIRRLIKFAKHIPEFKDLKQEDQISLLKGGIMEIMVLRSAMGFDPTNQQWKVKQMQDLREHGIDPNIIKEQLGAGMYTDHMKFVGSLHELTMSNRTIMTLLFVIEIFTPDRPNLNNKEAVAQTQEKFTTWLHLYLDSIMPIGEAKKLYPKLLVKLLDVRNLGESSAQLASHLDIQKLEPLLIEVFNLQK